MAFAGCNGHGKGYYLATVIVGAEQDNLVSAHITNITLRKVVCVQAVLLGACSGALKWNKTKNVHLASSTV